MMHADDVATRALDELALTAVACHVLEESAEGLRGVVRTGGVGDEVETHRATLEYDLLDAEVMAETAQARDEDEFFGLWGKGTEAVTQSGGEVLKLLVFAEAVQLTVEEDALAIRGYVLVGEGKLEVTLYLRLDDEAVGELATVTLLIVVGIDVCELIGLELSDSFGEDLLIGLVAHVGDEATLLGAEDVARTTLVKVL